MSRELVLVPKRKYDDLIRRAIEERTVGDSNKQIVKQKWDDENVDDTASENDKNTNSTTDGNISEENQYGGGASNPFTKMTFESFDKMHTNKRQKQKFKKKKEFEMVDFQL